VQIRTIDSLSNASIVLRTFEGHGTGVETGLAVYLNEFEHQKEFNPAFYCDRPKKCTNSIILG
jgi:hypothetical protein